MCGRFEHRGNLFDNLRNIRHYLSTRQERKTRGDVAQLGEHHVRNVGAEGSNPFISTMGTQAGRKKFRPAFLLPLLRPSGLQGKMRILLCGLAFQLLCHRKADSLHASLPSVRILGRVTILTERFRQPRRVARDTVA